MSSNLVLSDSHCNQWLVWTRLYRQNDENPGQEVSDIVVEQIVLQCVDHFRQRWFQKLFDLFQLGDVIGG